MLNAIVLASILFSSCVDSYCQHKATPLESLQMLSIKEEGPKRSPDLSPIRIKFFLLDFDLGNPEENDWFSSTFVKSVQDFFSSTLLVHSIQEPITLENIGECLDIKIPEAHQTHGVENTDIIVYTTTVHSDSTFIAASAPCVLEETGLNNIVAGMMMVNSPLYLESSVDTRFNTIIHEMIHILGFSDTLFPYFHKPDSSYYTPEELFVKYEARGMERIAIKSPTVLEVARETFACDRLQGLELEDQGGPGSAISHWETRVAYGDIMNAEAATNNLFTSFTFALLKDTGWYEINWSNVQTPIFGYKRGCQFLEEPCLENSIPNFPEFCSISEDRCDIYHLNKGTCMLTSYAMQIPNSYQYFSDPSQGGVIEYLDFCPIPVSSSNGSCRNSSTLSFSYFGETTCENCRCLEGTLVEDSALIDGELQHTGCYEVVECFDDYAKIRVGNEASGFHEVECPFSGGLVSVPGYFGHLKCPMSDILCQDVPCMSSCYGQGRCRKGKCHCNEGRGGSDCSVKCPNFCKKCDENAVCYECAQGYIPDTDGLCGSTENSLFLSGFLHY